MRRALLLTTTLLALTACGGSDDPGPAPTLPSLPPISLSPVGPADLSAPESLDRLLGAYDGDACAPITPVQVRDLMGAIGRVEAAVRAGTTIANDPPATSTSCLYAAIASTIGLSLPGPSRPPEVATYEAQVRDALAACPNRATRSLQVVGLPGTLISCPIQSARVLALRGRALGDGTHTSPTCAVLNAEQVDENRFLAFCADAFRRAAAPAGSLASPSPSPSPSPSASATPARPVSPTPR